MLLILIAAVASGLGAAGLVLGGARLLGRKAPRWLAPAAGGAAMFAFMLWNEYSWYERAVAELPPGAVVARSYQYRSAVQPWTLLAPRIARFVAVDLAGAQPDEAAPGALRFETLLVERLKGVLRLPQVIDCAGGRRGTPRGSAVDWVAPEPGDPLLAAVCGAAPAGRTD